MELVYLLTDDEGHGFANPENQLRPYHAVERHFAEHLDTRHVSRTN